MVCALCIIPRFTWDDAEGLSINRLTHEISTEPKVILAIGKMIYPIFSTGD